MNFTNLDLIESFNSYFQEQGLVKPTDVQMKAIPLVLAKKSSLVVAQTGTGKTLAFALPLIQNAKLHEIKFGRSTKRAHPLSVIVAPTKELAGQIYSVMKEISHHVKFKARLLTGGMKNEVAAKLTKETFEILITTPSKLSQAFKNKWVHAESITQIVFDEVDTLFEMGFQKDIDQIFKRVNIELVEVHLFSATLSTSIEAHMLKRLEEKEFNKVILSDAHRVQSKIETFNIYVSHKERVRVLMDFLKKAKGRGIIFANQKNQVESIHEEIQKNHPNLKYKVLHGDKSSTERLAVIKSFRQNKAQLLLATDVAARGIDITDLQWVLNFNLPRNAEFYLHRTGRVARMGRTGLVYNLVSQEDAKLVASINEAIKSQGSLNLKTIAKDIHELKRKKAKKKAPANKRIKITKRNKHLIDSKGSKGAKSPKKSKKRK